MFRSTCAGFLFSTFVHIRIDLSNKATARGLGAVKLEIEKAGSSYVEPQDYDRPHSQPRDNRRDWREAAHGPFTGVTRTASAYSKTAGPTPRIGSRRVAFDCSFDPRILKKSIRENLGL
jgi:hypothetical protein